MNDTTCAMKLSLPVNDTAFMHVASQIFLELAPLPFSPPLTAKDCYVSFIDQNEHLLDVELENSQGRAQLTIDVEKLSYVEVRYVFGFGPQLEDLISEKYSQNLADIFSKVMKTTVKFTDLSYYSRIKYTEVDLQIGD